MRPLTDTTPRAAPSGLTVALPRALVTARVRALAGALGAAVVFLLVRIVKLDALPLFTDEGFYIEWALYALHSPSLADKVMSMTDGKQPLLPWLMVPFLALMDDRTVAGRMAPVTAGLVSFFTLFWLGKRLYGGRVGALAALLYLVAPLSYFYDRIMLYDGLIAACALLSFAAGVRWLERPTFGRALALGGCLALTLLTKPSSLAVVVSVLPAAALVQAPRWRDRGTWIGLALAGAVCVAVAGALLLHPDAAKLLPGMSDRYFLAPDQLAGLPWPVWAETLRDIGDGMVHYLPAPLWWLWAAGLCLPLFTRRKEDFALAGWSVWLALSLVIPAKIYYFRYYVPALVVAVLPAARALDVLLRGVDAAAGPFGPGYLLLRRSAMVAVLVLILAPGVATDVRLALDPRQVPLPGGPRGDAFHFQSSHNTAWGFAPVAHFLDQQVGLGDAVYVVPALGGLTRGWAQANVLFEPGAHVVLNDPRRNPVEQILALDADDEARRIAVGGGPVYVVTSEWADAPSAAPLLEDGRVRGEMVVDAPHPAIALRHRVYRLDMPRHLDRVRFPQPPAFGSHIRLLGVDIEPASTQSARERTLTLYWRTERRLDTAYAVFVHLVAGGLDGAKVAQHDGDPGDGRLPTDRWKPGEIIRDRRTLTLTGPACGPLRLLVGMYDRKTQARLPAAGGGLAVRDNAAELYTLPASVSGCAG